MSTSALSDRVPERERESLKPPPPERLWSPEGTAPSPPSPLPLEHLRPAWTFEAKAAAKEPCQSTVNRHDLTHTHTHTVPLSIIGGFKTQTYRVRGPQVHNLYSSPSRLTSLKQQTETASSVCRDSPSTSCVAAQPCGSVLENTAEAELS